MAENALIVVEQVNPVDVFVKGGLDPLLTDLERLAKEEINGATIETPKGRKVYASVAYKVARTKTGLDSAGKSLVEEQKRQLKQIDNERKRMRDFCESLQAEIRHPLTEWEKAEEERIAREKAEKQFLEDWDAALAENEIFDRQREVERREREMAEKEAAQKAKEEAERRAKEQAEREEHIRIEAAERAKREAEEAAQRERDRYEQEKRDAEERARQAEQDRLDAIQRAKKEQERAAAEAARKERERIEAEQRAKEQEEARVRAEAERLAANKAHQAKINREALASFTAHGYTEDQGKAIISLIASGKIKHVSINY